jgi:hypothetical protein
MRPAWRARLRLAASIGIPPADFWRLSVAEWRALTEAAPETRAMERAALAGLMKDYPDIKND